MATSRPSPRCSPSPRATRRSSPRPKRPGAEGVTLAGICCTANEILMRHGIPVAGNFLQQELAIITGAVEMLITDVQCCMPSLPEVAQAYHTEIVSTSDIAKTIGATHMPFDEEHALESAKDAHPPGHRQFQEPRPAQGHHPQGLAAAGGRLQRRRHQIHARRHVPRLLPPAERRDHPGPHQGHRRHRRLQQPKDQDRLLHQRPDPRADQAQGASCSRPAARPSPPPRRAC